ncbi:MAG: hypothetical protein M0Z60_02335 [Nitrospiraceae bacterium]|nr:hypothetical protein [Nitrospiraceae bacterium]
MLSVTKTGGESTGKGRCGKFAVGGSLRLERAAILPPCAEESCFGVSPAMVIAAGPFIGLAYALFLPFIGITLLLLAAFRRLFGGLLQSAYRGAVFTWRPSEAYLTGKKGRTRRIISKKEEEKKE